MNDKSDSESPDVKNLLDHEDGTAPANCAVSRPEGIPEKFWNEADGEVRTDALLQSYLELERKLGGTLPLPRDDGDEEQIRRLQEALGRPASADDYAIETGHDLFTANPEVNKRLHEAGFNQQQAQLVYDLAVEHVAPVIGEAFEELHASREIDRLRDRFGGEETWGKLSKQLKNWGEAHLADDIFETLASSYDGIVVLHEMMAKSEPELAGDGAGGLSELTEDTLNEMVRDPRYWRDRDPDFIARVTDGFRRLFPT